MSKEVSLIRYTIHKVCAHPFAICWMIGTLAIWIPLTVALFDHGVFGTFQNHWAVIPLLIVCYAATSGLGFFAGSFCVSGFVLPICRRLNGAPHEAGDRVLILCGDRAGTATSIYEITTGQGGQPLPRVEIGTEAKDSFRDLFDDYSLLRLSPLPKPGRPSRGS